MQGEFNRVKQASVYSWLLALLLVGCAQTGVSSSPPATAVAQESPGVGTCVPDAAWVVPGQGITTYSQVISRYATSSVVLLGEFHDSRAHHLWQLQVISALAARRPRIAIGLEMLPRSAQPILDQWIEGSLSDVAFLEQAKWYDYWKFDADLYMPILEFARLNKIPVYALNVEKDLVKAVRKSGWDAIPVAQRFGISDPAPASAAYLEMLAATFRMHGNVHGHAAAGNDASVEELYKDPNFKKFVQGQQLWDRGMAESIVQARHNNEDVLMVAIMGSGHIMNGFGVPHQLAAMGTEKVGVLMPWDRGFVCDMLTADFADAVFGIMESAQAVQEKPKLGVHIEPTSDGVKVVKVVEKSIAEASGINADDVIVKIAGREAKEVTDIIDAVQGMAPGTWLPITVVRGDAHLDVIAKFP